LLDEYKEACQILFDREVFESLDEDQQNRLLAVVLDNTRSILQLLESEKEME